MRPVPFPLLKTLVEDPDNGWSIGSFGAIGEFMREADEPCDIRGTDAVIEAVTDRGAMRLGDTQLQTVAWDSLAPDGESWGHEVAFCTRRLPTSRRTVLALGADETAIRPVDSRATLFDLGIASGCIRMCVRTSDRSLVRILSEAEGLPLFAVAGAVDAIKRAQPHRVMLSPAGRIEVYQAIPAADGQSPIGPHTHVLPHAIVKDRPHSSNIPIPDGWQAALSMHPRSPWRTPLGERHPYAPAIDARFAPLLTRFGLEEDETIAVAIATSLGNGPEAFDWPRTRRGRHKARITLRRLAIAGDPRVAPWRTLYDRGQRD